MSTTPNIRIAAGLLSDRRAPRIKPSPSLAQRLLRGFWGVLRSAKAKIAAAKLHRLRVELELRGRRLPR